MKIGYYEYAVTSRSTPFNSVELDQVSGEKQTSESDKTLKSFRDVGVGAGDLTGCLGLQMVPISKESQIRVGDELTVLEHGELVITK
jgi:hypothetical protein